MATVSKTLFICPAVSPWRAVQASSFARTASTLAADGMYIDQFGFAGADKDCHSPDHGHEVPSYAVAVEGQLTREIRDAMTRAGFEAVLYSEETPVDLLTQYQDGSFTYAMFSARQWFEPETLAEIRRCHVILAAHRDAFTTLQPEPLVETEMGGVFANRFPTEDKGVYTLLNTRHRTVRGPVLRLPHVPSARYHDAWHRRPAEVIRDGDWALVSTELGPHGAGCIIVDSAGRTP